MCTYLQLIYSNIHKLVTDDLFTFPFLGVILYDLRENINVCTPIPSSHSACFITLTSQWSRWRLKSPASRLFTQSLIQAQIKENIKIPCHWPLCGEFTGPMNSSHKGPVTRKMFPFDDVIMSFCPVVYLVSREAHEKFCRRHKSAACLVLLVSVPFLIIL